MQNSLYIHLSVERHLGVFHFFVIINEQGFYKHEHIGFCTKIKFSLNYLGAWLLYCVANLYLTL